MSIEGRWDEMAGEITDEMLDAFAVVGDYDEIVGRIKERYGRYATSVGFSIPNENSEDRDRLKGLVRQLQAT
jgi:alkanesulfonate monooxygenase SsuD/methylene tetrahydromethanopterin reductase-like flavin-dependent oxidoreductase (luciferase family)